MSMNKKPYAVSLVLLAMLFFFDGINFANIKKDVDFWLNTDLVAMKDEAADRDTLGCEHRRIVITLVSTEKLSSNSILHTVIMK